MEVAPPVPVPAATLVLVVPLVADPGAR